MGGGGRRRPDPIRHRNPDAESDPPAAKGPRISSAATAGRRRSRATLRGVEPDVRTVRLREPGSRRRASAGPPGWLVPLLPPLLLGAVLLGTAIVMQAPTHLLGFALGGALLFGFGWILASTLLPAAPVDRRCPRCGAEDGLRPASRDTTRGVACDVCDWTDETASAWMIAEEDGPLEDVVLLERAARRKRDHGSDPPQERNR